MSNEINNKFEGSVPNCVDNKLIVKSYKNDISILNGYTLSLQVV